MNINLTKLGIQTLNFLNNAGVGAFLGAFFAFIFGIIAYDYTKKREKWKLHHDTLVKAEYLINRHLDQISGNIFLLKSALDTYSKGAFSENILSTIENPQFLPDFHNIELINVYANYQSLVEKVNHDLEAWNKSNDRLFTVALSGIVPVNDISKNRENLSKRTMEIINHGKDLMDETYTIGAYIREFLKVDKRPRFANLNITANIKIPLNRVVAERITFVKESQETMQKDYEKRLKKYNLK